MRSTPLIFASLSILALSACSASSPADPQDGTMEAMPHVTINWILSNEKTDDTGMTTADVALQVRTSADDVELVPLGNYAGCGEEAMPSDGALLTLKCWWAGGGDEFQVRMEGTGTLSIDHRGLDEMTDIPEFEPKESVEIPERAMIMTTGKKTI